MFKLLWHFMLLFYHGRVWLFLRGLWYWKGENFWMLRTSSIVSIITLLFVLFLPFALMFQMPWLQFFGVAWFKTSWSGSLSRIMLLPSWQILFIQHGIIEQRKERGAPNQPLTTTWGELEPPRFPIRSSVDTSCTLGSMRINAQLKRAILTLTKYWQVSNLP